MRGPLNIARPVQGWPVIVQAGASEAGRQLAAETAEAVFTGGGTLADGQKLYADIKGRMDKLGRDPEHLKILPGAFVVVGDSVEEAKEKRAQARQPGALRQRHRLAVDRARHRRLAASIPTGRCRRSPKPTPAKSGRQRLVDVAARDKLTVRQLAQRVGGYGGLSFVGTPQDHRRPDGGMADEPTAATASTSCSRSCPRASTISSTRWCRNCRGAGFSARSMKAGRCGRIWGCRGRKTGSSRVNRRSNFAVRRFLPAENLDFGRSEARLPANAGRFGRRPDIPHI